VGDEWVGCPIYARSDLEPGMQLDAPAVVEEFGSTTVAFPGWTARVDGYENLVMERVV
jgi:N-methylhydantoinase A/oxoprolinase/acetone carboxylase beta subunit